MNKITLFDMLVFVGFNTDDADKISDYLDGMNFTISQLVEFIKEYAQIVKIAAKNILQSFTFESFYVTIDNVCYRVKKEGELYELRQL